ncbi:MAG: prepilin-type N-terminal cleavage/methylation domain-containing protein [Planctomycetota bacterium]
MTRVQNRQAGFTLVEGVVAISIVALLAAILTPLVVQQIDEAKLSRARNEVQVIAAAIGKFYKDVGQFPTEGDAERLLSGVTADIEDNIDRYTGEDANGWYTGTENSTFEDHLTSNTAGYPDSGEFRWKGPFLGSVNMDPWGRPYICNVAATGGAVADNGSKCVVLTAGPDGTIETLSVLTAADDAVGDDVLALVYQR